MRENTMRGPGYLLVIGRIPDLAKMAAYNAALPPIYQAHEGTYLGLGGPSRGVAWLDGDWAGRSVVLARFPDFAAISAFWDSPAYTQAKVLRAGVGDFEVFAILGQALPPPGTTVFLIRIERAAEQTENERSAGITRTAAEAAGLTVLASAKSKDIRRLEGSGNFNVFLLAAPDTETARKFHAETTALPSPAGGALLLTARA